MIDDVTTSALQMAVSGLAQRQRVIADNLANIETPGFRAGRVTFENALQTAVRDGISPSSVTPTTARSLEPTRTDGNNVNIDEEVLSHTNTVMTYQLALRALDSKYGLLRDVIKAGA
ncbi:MAG: flagellar biosynthesis protein FlgB [Pseudonocardiales bacterium]|nr:MAG: flagellar biosynthesis protein FlgB [Pseudonocardiales bacterium]